IPLTGDPQTFRRAAELGRTLLDLHTYLDVPRGSARCTVVDPGERPMRFEYDAQRQTLHIEDGRIEAVRTDVWDFDVSVLWVVKSWLRRRTLGPRRPSSVLDEVRACWSSGTLRE